MTIDQLRWEMEEMVESHMETAEVPELAPPMQPLWGVLMKGVASHMGGDRKSLCKYCAFL